MGLIDDAILELVHRSIYGTVRAGSTDGAESVRSRGQPAYPTGRSDDPRDGTEDLGKPIEEAAGMEPSPVEVLALPDFNKWYASLDDDAKRVADELVDKLRTFGVNLSEPYSRSFMDIQKKMRYLRHATGKYPLRIPYMFDPQRRAILITGDSKKGKGDRRGYADDLASTAKKIWSRAIGESVVRESAVDTIAVVMGRFDPFHGGHAAIVRQAAGTNSKVVVFVQREGRLPMDLRMEMIEASLPDVWSKVEVYPATVSGQPTDSIVELIANAAATGRSSIKPDSAVNVIETDDVLAQKRKEQTTDNALKTQQGQRAFSGPITVSVVREESRFSDEKTERAIASGDEKELTDVLDPHLVGNPPAFKNAADGIFATAKVNEIVDAIVSEINGAMHGGAGDTLASKRGGSSAISNGPAALAKNRKDPQIVAHSNPNRMMQFTHGNERHMMPGQEEFEEEGEDTWTTNKPTDLSNAVSEAIERMLGRDDD